MRLISAFLIFLMVVGGWLCCGLYPNVDWVKHVASKVLYATATAAFGLAVLFIPSRAYATDKTARAWMACALVGSAVLLPLAIAQRQEMQVVEKMEAEMAETATALRLQIRQREQAALDALKKDLPPDRYTVYEGRVEATSLIAIRKLDREMKAELDAASSAYRNALDKFATRGPDEWVLYRTREQLESEYGAHTQLYSATRAFSRVVQTYEERYLARIEELDLQPPADRIAIAELERILQFWEQQQTYTVRRLDEAVLAAAIRVLNVLRENWGDWSYSPREQQMNFKDPAAEIAFAEALAEMMAANAALREIDPEDKNPEEEL